MRASPEFPSVPSLRSTDSAPSRLGLFTGFNATMKESDFSCSCIIGYGSSPSQCGPLGCCGQAGDLPVPKQGAYMHARFYDLAGPNRYSRSRTCSYCLPHWQKRRHPDLLIFRGSMAGLHAPLSTLRHTPHGVPRMTRGQCDSLGLHCIGLPPTTPCRSPGALP
jgi:hypothetical protein